MVCFKPTLSRLSNALKINALSFIDWWERFMEKVSLERGVKKRRSDGW